MAYFASDGKTYTASLNFRRVKRLWCILRLEAKHCWNYFAFNQLLQPSSQITYFNTEKQARTWELHQGITSCPYTVR